MIEVLAGAEEAVALGLVGFAAVLAARLISCIITSSIITRFNSEKKILFSKQFTIALSASTPPWAQLTQGGWQLSSWED